MHAKESQLSRFLATFQLLCNMQTSPSQREDMLESVIKDLLMCPADMRLDVLNILSSLIQAKPSIVSGCGKVIQEVVRVIMHLSLAAADKDKDKDKEPCDSAVRLASLRKLFWIMGVLGRENLSVKDVSQLFSLFQAVLEGKAPPTVCAPILATLCAMSASSTDEPSFCDATIQCQPSVSLVKQTPQVPVLDLLQRQEQALQQKHQQQYQASQFVHQQQCQASQFVPKHPRAAYPGVKHRNNVPNTEQSQAQVLGSLDSFVLKRKTQGQGSSVRAFGGKEMKESSASASSASALAGSILPPMCYFGFNGVSSSLVLRTFDRSGQLM